MADHNEVEFEKELCEYLEAHGWAYSKTDAGYDKERALYPADFFAWVADTEPNVLAKVVTSGGADEAKQRGQLLDRLAKVLDTPHDQGGGTLNALRKGFAHLSARFQVCQFRPETTLNKDTVERYGKVRLRVMRQVHFSTADKRSVDLVFFVNGLPVATAELKTDFTQSVEEAVAQYRRTRRPRDPGTNKEQPLFRFGRALVHFAVSNDEVWMTTKLDGDNTHFLPFNRGDEDDGAGNPNNPDGSPTAYLWERVLQRDSWLDILGKFLHVETKKTYDPILGRASARTTMLFPRFHQWEVVNALVNGAGIEGPGHKYLIQHSAGSGKTNSIAWTAHRLARLQVDNSLVFDKVIVVTDRTVLDAQLQEAVKQIDSSGADIVLAVNESEIRKSNKGRADVSKIKSKSGLLAEALTGSRPIIVVTLQTFPFALAEIRKNKGLVGRSFAVIADEAHSSQTGQASKRLRKVLSPEEVKDIEDGGTYSVEDELAAEMEETANASNISYFAFTATPKGKTLTLFGRPGSDGKPVPFHEYTMKQAIEEEFILDILIGYHSFKLAFEVAQKASKRHAASDASQEVDQAEAAKQVLKWVKRQPQTIDQKAAIIVEHFEEQVRGLLDGHAKAMVVADSRLAAVRYKRAIDKFIAAKGYALGTLVAFSGDDVPGLDPAIDGPGPYNERTLNPDDVHDLRSAFAGDPYKVMIVANKFQTGFDQPLLCAMYIDRPLSGVTAVQTLSRLNRTYRTPEGEEKVLTFIVDFVNKPADIKTAFEPYYKGAYLETETDPNVIHDIGSKLDTAGIYTEAEIDQVADVLVKGRGNNALAAALTPAKNRFMNRYKSALAKEDKGELDNLDMFRKDVGTYVRVYDFMSQIINYGDTAILKKADFLRLLERLIRPTNYTTPVDLSGLVLKNVKQLDKGKANITLTGEKGVKGVTAAGSGAKKDPKMVAFQEVLDRLNDVFGDEHLHPGQKEAFIESLLSTLLLNEKLIQQALINRAEQFAESPDFHDAVIEAVAENQDASNALSEGIYGGSKDVERLITALGVMFKVMAEERRTPPQRT